MKHMRTGSHRAFFKVVAETRSAQAAVMVLKPGQTSGEPSNEHPRSEQWLFVISGSGTAIVNKHSIAIRSGSLLLIEKGEIHQIKNSSRRSLVTLNLYAPPAYTKDGELRSSN